MTVLSSVDFPIPLRPTTASAPCSGTDEVDPLEDRRRPVAGAELGDLDLHVTAVPT